MSVAEDTPKNYYRVNHKTPLGMLKISVVTPTLNRRKFIKQALDSVKRQRYPEIEHIVVDGGSTDGTIKFLEKYIEENPYVRLIKTRTSFSHQFNVGLRNSSGDVLVYLPDDDILADGLFDTLSQVFSSDPELEIVSGGIAIFRGNDPSNIVKVVYPEFSYRGLIRMPAYESSKFVRRRVIEKVGLLDERYNYAAHREWFIRMLILKLKHIYIPKICYFARAHELSSSMKSSIFRLLDYTPDLLDVWRRYLKAHGILLDKSIQNMILKRAYRDALTGTWLALKKRDYNLFYHHVKYGTLIFPYFPFKMVGNVMKNLWRRVLKF